MRGNGNQQSTTHEKVKPTQMRVLRRNLSGTDYTKCVFCQQNKKSTRNRRLKEPLVLCATHETGEKVSAAAEILSDERLKLSVHGGDLVAMDVQYHKTCHRNATRSKTLNLFLQAGADAEGDKPAAKAHSLAFAATCEDVDRLVVQGGKVLRMIQIRDMYVKQLGGHTSSTDLEYRADVLRKKLENKFGNVLQFAQATDSKKSTLVFADASKGEILQSLLQLETEAQECVHEEDDLFSSPLPSVAQDPERLVLFHAAQAIRCHLLKVKNTMSWPPKIDEYAQDDEVSIVPDPLFNLLAWIIGDVESPRLPQRQPLVVDG